FCRTTSFSGARRPHVGLAATQPKPRRYDLGNRGGFPTWAGGIPNDLCQGAGTDSRRSRRGATAGGSTRGTTSPGTRGPSGQRRAAGAEGGAGRPHLGRLAAADVPRHARELRVRAAEEAGPERGATLLVGHSRPRLRPRRAGRACRSAGLPSPDPRRAATARGPRPDRPRGARAGPRPAALPGAVRRLGGAG